MIYNSFYNTKTLLIIHARTVIRVSRVIDGFSLITDCLGFDSWKRLGDIISSIYALGYHEQNRTSDNCPKFLKHIREAVFAFTYSADKNVSIFLGRPPRMQRRYCDFDFLQCSGSSEDFDFDQISEYLGWSVENNFDYMIEAWWSVVCALQKEEILQVFREKSAAEKSRKAR